VPICSTYFIEADYLLLFKGTCKNVIYKFADLNKILSSRPMNVCTMIAFGGGGGLN
jgi:hypothetical protein